MLERTYQAGLIKRLYERFPGCFILKNDSGYLQGVPDLLVLWRNKWAMLEVKAKEPVCSNDFEPNQEWYLELLDSMSFARCIFPENEEEVLDALERSFSPRRKARLPVS